MNLDDTSPMPFGVHKGKPMSDVPVSYLQWLWNSGLKSDKANPVHGYIKQNLNALRMENADLIWD